MEVEFLSKFNKDLSKITSRSVKGQIKKAILQVESASTINAIPQIKKLRGFKNAYRIRIGDFRIGLFIEGDTAEFARVIHRKEIYRLFP